ncbi:hypothetical protein CP556_17755 [Natrinema sp. CBA1119]|nr:hypothetical protein CP556_17755 [Natrinema sp. CBA1119]
METSAGILRDERVNRRTVDSAPSTVIRADSHARILSRFDRVSTKRIDSIASGMWTVSDAIRAGLSAGDRGMLGSNGGR